MAVRSARLHSLLRTTASEQEHNDGTRNGTNRRQRCPLLGLWVVAGRRQLERRGSVASEQSVGLVGSRPCQQKHLLAAIGRQLVFGPTERLSRLGEALPRV